MANYEPIDNDSDVDEFDVEKIEQMQVEFKTCPHCGGAGYRNNGIYSFTCPACHGTGVVLKGGSKWLNIVPQNNAKV